MWPSLRTGTIIFYYVPPPPSLCKAKLLCQKSPSKINFSAICFPIWVSNAGRTSRIWRISRRCAICKEWKHKKSINHHIKLVHNTNKEKCDHCGLVVKTIKKLQAPVVKVHTKDIPGHCEFCDQVFINQQKPNYHKGCVHNSRDCNDFKCEVSSKAYSSKANIHMNTKHK